MPVDSWILENSEIPLEVLHALGVISFRWNSCEFGLKMLFSIATNMNHPNALLITQDMGPITISNIIRETRELPKNHPDKIADVFYALTLFDANRLNRNQLTHYLPAGTLMGIEFRKNKEMGGLTGEVIPNSINDVRRVADDIFSLRVYLSRLHNHLANYKHSDTHPLPDRPPLPEKLLKPPLQDHAKRQSRRQSSRK